MTYDEIKNQDNETVIRAITGRITKVYPPSTPSPAQAKNNIHPQGFVLQDDQGESLTMRFISASQHLDESAEGRIFHFQSVPKGEGGRLSGLTVQKYTSQKPNNKGEVKVYVQVEKLCHYYEVEEEQKPDQPSNPDKPEVARTNPAPEKPPITVGGLVSLYANITREMETQLEGTKVFEAMLTEPRALIAASSSVFIEACKQGLQYRTGLVTESKPTEVVEEASNEVTLLDLAKMAQEGHKDVEPFHDAMGIPWSKLWDATWELEKEHNFSDEAMGAGWEKYQEIVAKEDGKIPNNERLCRAICLDWKGFIMVVKAAATFGEGTKK